MRGLIRAVFSQLKKKVYYYKEEKVYFKHVLSIDGFRNVLRRLEEAKIYITSLTTDRHKQIRNTNQIKKYITHQFDVWHVGRNIKKKLLKLAKKKCNKELNHWIKAIVNHFWWCCASCGGNDKELEEKWTSILYHMNDRHHCIGKGTLSTKSVSTRIYPKKSETVSHI